MYGQATTDSWLLLAVGYAGPPLDEERTLPAIVAAADAINHAVPVTAEVDGAMRRLTAFGLLTVSTDKVALTPSGRELLQRVQGKSWLEEWKHLTVEIDRLGEPPEDSGQSFKAADIRRAIDAYTHHASERPPRMNA